MSQEKIQLIIVTGVSGSGKTVALNALEDIGFNCIDNLPVALLDSLCQTLIENSESEDSPKTAIGIDARMRHNDLSQVADIITRFAAEGIKTKVLYLDAADDILVTRYSETRRRHPLSSDQIPLEEAIRLEREMLLPLHKVAGFYLDTSDMTLHQLREQIRLHLTTSEDQKLSLLIQSFGFKHGTPKNANMLFDVRCLPNPHWIPELRPLTGKDKPVADFLGSDSQVERMYEQVSAFIDEWLPCFRQEGRSYLTVAIGCTGGQHRSVYLTERLARHFQGNELQVLVRHRELT